MSKTPIYIGIDSGGTKTLGIASTQDGEIIKEYRTVGANPYDIGWERCYEIFRDCVNALTLQDIQVEKVCISGAGIGEIDAEVFCKLYGTLALKPSQLVIIGDAYAAHIGAFAGSDGILIVAGTGTNMIARRQSEIIRVGGWGHILGDQCSGYGIALDAIRQSVIDCDLQVDSPLFRAVKKHYEIETVAELLAKLQDAPKSRIAAFVKEVLDLAGDGDANSITIVEQHFRVFEQQLAYLKGKLERPRVSYVGGLFEHSYYWSMFVGVLEHLQLDIQEPTFSPVEAALQIAIGKLEAPPELMFSPA